MGVWLHLDQRNVLEPERESSNSRDGTQCPEEPVSHSFPNLGP